MRDHASVLIDITRDTGEQMTAEVAAEVLHVPVTRASRILTGIVKRGVFVSYLTRVGKRRVTAYRLYWQAPNRRPWLTTRDLVIQYVGGTGPSSVGRLTCITRNAPEQVRRVVSELVSDGVLFRNSAGLLDIRGSHGS